MPIQVVGELNSINEIYKIGLEAFVEKYSLSYKDYGHKFSLKYHQLDTKKTDSTNECRGLILAKDSFRVLSMPLVRFSNYSQHTAKSLDWESAKYYEKTDGTMIQYYYDDIVGKWCVGTTGTAEAVENVSCRDKVNKTIHRYDFSLTDLFYKTCEELGVNLKNLEKGFTYIFELATKYNMVINTYPTSTINLLAMRSTRLDQDYHEFMQQTVDDQAKVINCGRPKEYFFESQEEMISSLKNVKHGDENFEGYVVVDKDNNRLKVKSNAYILYSHFNADLDALTESKWRLADVVINNEIDEVSASFPALRETLDEMKIKYDELIEPVKEKFEYLRENYDSLERKDFFVEASNAINHDKNKKPLLSVFTQLYNDRDISFEKAFDIVKREKVYKLIKVKEKVQEDESESES